MTHIDESGKASMVDVSEKTATKRTATAMAQMVMASATVEAIRSNGLKKGDVLAVARVAGIQAAKQTAMLIPLCHTLPLSHVGVEFQLEADRITITSSATTIAGTGVEMEALTCASVAALTIYDMAKSIDKGMVITDIRLLAKTK